MVTAYPVAGKAKSLDICRAFVEGCGGIVSTNAQTLFDGPAFFYGVDSSNKHLFDAALYDTAREFYYCDNSYFDNSRQQFFRVTRNQLQHSGLGRSNGKRFAALGIPIAPWRRQGAHVVVCPQSESFMHDIAKYPGDWLHDTTQRLRAASPLRELRVRAWSSDKGALASTLAQDLVNAHALVTWSSAAAVTAILAGVPAFCSAFCAAWPIANKSLALIEHPERPDGRENWAGVLADNQWTINELRSGKAWSDLHGG